MLFLDAYASLFRLIYLINILKCCCSFFVVVVIVHAALIKSKYSGTKIISFFFSQLFVSKLVFY